MEDTAPADALVLFGAMRNLAHKRLFPALDHMVQLGHLHVPGRFDIVEPYFHKSSFG